MLSQERRILSGFWNITFYCCFISFIAIYDDKIRLLSNIFDIYVSGMGV
jgi:hypothetical protein